jgi:pilus assembly protein Flp/PilA
MSVIKKFFKNEAGATAIEYGLIAALVGVVIIAGISATGDATTTMYERITNVITAAIDDV